VTFSSHSLLAAAAGLWLALPLPGQEPARLQIDRNPAMLSGQDQHANQLMADRIGETLRQNGQLRHYDLDVVVQGGTVTLSGVVADQPQREETLRMVQGFTGVEHVVDRIKLTSPIMPVQAPAVPEVAPPPQILTEAPNGMPAEPTPINQGPPPGPNELNPPYMPPHAWPTYAPYDNYSRVAYPTAYPYQSWPFIGPCYPFPIVPLGWRSVKLEWQDGHWWFGRVGTPHDWWRIRYW
jgi:BON domain